MTTRTEYPIYCPCGHKGAIKMIENDQPFSKQYETYTLINLEGGGQFHIRGLADWEQVFKELKPTCPACHHSLTIQNMEEA